MFRSPPNCPTNSRSRVGGFVTLLFFFKKKLYPVIRLLSFFPCVCVCPAADGQGGGRHQKRGQRMRCALLDEVKSPGEPHFLPLSSLLHCFFLKKILFFFVVVDFWVLLLNKWAYLGLLRGFDLYLLTMREVRSTILSSLLTLKFLFAVVVVDVIATLERCVWIRGEWFWVFFFSSKSNSHYKFSSLVTTLLSPLLNCIFFNYFFSPLFIILFLLMLLPLRWMIFWPSFFSLSFFFGFTFDNPRSHSTGVVLRKQTELPTVYFFVKKKELSTFLLKKRKVGGGGHWQHLPIFRRLWNGSKSTSGDLFLFFFIKKRRGGAGRRASLLTN